MNLESSVTGLPGPYELGHNTIVKQGVGSRPFGKLEATKNVDMKSIFGLMFVNSAVNAKGKQLSRQNDLCLKGDRSVLNLVGAYYLQRCRPNPF